LRQESRERRKPFPGFPRGGIGPAHNKERIDVALLREAEQEIDMAAYVLTDRAVIEALRRAAERA
jgi:phosphatidylserine/phosphatidylglycerophosphate/cardiolipin synthase-like enzyme